MWVYLYGRDTGSYEVGFWVGEEWQRIELFQYSEDAAKRVHYLNGGS